MSRRHAPERESGYSRDDRGDRRERDARTAQRERDAGSRTPVRANADVRPTTSGESRNVTATEPRSVALARPGAESRDTRGVVDPRSARDPAYGQNPRVAMESSNQRPADVARDLTREIRTAPPVVTREQREIRLRPEEISSRQAPTNDYFLPGEDISRDVITADICRYLGPDALVRPYRHQDGRSGYLITAYRALTSAMITTLKQDSLKFESENSRRRDAGHREQTYAPTAYDQSGRMDGYGGDRNAAPMSRVDSRYEPEPRRSRPQPSGYDDMDIDEPQDSRAPRYARETYDSRDPQGRPQVPAAYAQPGRDSYAYDSRSDPRLDSRVDRRLDPHADSRVDPRVDPRGYPQTAGIPTDGDYPMVDSRLGYGDSRAPQPIYAAARPIPYGAVPPSQAGAIPRAARDEPQVYIDPQTGRPVVAAPRSSEVRHARPDRDYDNRGYR